MTVLRIPKEGQKALWLLSSLNDAAVDELIAAVDRQQPAIFGDEFVRRTVGSLKTLREQEAVSILKAAFGILLAKGSKSRSVEAICQDVVAAARRELQGDLALDDASLERLTARLGRLLSTPALEISTKASDIFGEHQYVFLSARILTDIRTVFRDDATSPPAAAVVFHNLKIEYQEGKELKQLFVTLDSTDLDALIEVLSRAKDKERAIQSMLAASNLPRL